MKYRITGVRYPGYTVKNRIVELPKKITKKNFQLYFFQLNFCEIKNGLLTEKYLK